MGTTPALTVAGLLERGAMPQLRFELLGGREGQNRTIANPHVQKTGLALAGFHEYLREGRILVFGESEIRYLESLAAERLEAVLARTLTPELPCVVVTGGWAVPAGLVAAVDRHRFPLLRTHVSTPIAITRLSALLDDALAEREILHGVLLDILGLGVLLVGESGIGKIECALDLVVRGHRLVADDTVEVRRRGEAVILGTCPALTRHHMELRGLGIINVRDLFGVSATRAAKRVELVVRLERWDPAQEYDRLGLDESAEELVGVPVPLVRMPVAPGRNLATLVEVAARNQLHRVHGMNAARDLVNRLEQQLLAEEPVAEDEEESEADPEGGEPA
jgi:HPr kinase/phosphorylase